jgi:hypothetical protein
LHSSIRWTLFLQGCYWKKSKSRERIFLNSSFRAWTTLILAHTVTLVRTRKLAYFHKYQASAAGARVAPPAWTIHGSKKGAAQSASAESFRFLFEPHTPSRRSGEAWESHVFLNVSVGDFSLNAPFDPAGLLNDGKACAAPYRTFRTIFAPDNPRNCDPRACASNITPEALKLAAAALGNACLYTPIVFGGGGAGIEARMLCKSTEYRICRCRTPDAATLPSMPECQTLSGARRRMQWVPIALPMVSFDYLTSRLALEMQTGSRFVVLPLRSGGAAAHKIVFLPKHLGSTYHGASPVPRCPCNSEKLGRRIPIGNPTERNAEEGRALQVHWLLEMISCVNVKEGQLEL